MSRKIINPNLSWVTRARNYEIGDMHAMPSAPAYQSSVDHVDKRIKEAVESVELSDRIHLHPYKQGLWVSIQTGRTYRGNGGKAHDEWGLEQQGPWILVDESDAESLVERCDLEHADGRAKELERFIAELGDSINTKIKEY